MFLAWLLPALTHHPLPTWGCWKIFAERSRAAFQEPKLALRVCVHADKHSSGHMVGYIC